MSESLATPFTAVAAGKKKRPVFLPVKDRSEMHYIHIKDQHKNRGKERNSWKAKSYCTYKTPGYCLTVISFLFV